MNRLARYLWAAPCSAAGVLAALALAAGVGARAAWHGGVLEVHARPRGPRRARWLQALPFCAITLGHVVLACDQRTMRRCRAHERVHVRQCERWGPLFFPAYLAAGAWQAMRGRGAYRDNPFEVEARGRA